MAHKRSDRVLLSKANYLNEAGVRKGHDRGMVDFTELSSYAVTSASDSEIRSWSSGEITSSKCFDRTTNQPVTGGLFCRRVFGPIEELVCACRRSVCDPEYLNCDACHLLPEYSRKSNNRLGHIKLASPVVHPLFIRSPSILALLLEVSDKRVEQWINGDLALVCNSKAAQLPVGSQLSKAELDDSRQRFGEDAFEVLTGALAIEALLSKLDLKKVRRELEGKLSGDSQMRRSQYQERFQWTELFLNGDVHIGHVVLRTIPVIPACQRWMDIGSPKVRRSNRELNRLYARVIRCNQQLLRRIQLDGPQNVSESVHRKLQSEVNQLFEKILARVHQRSRMLGVPKRVDYSARCILVPNAKLQLGQCGLPTGMALELFKTKLVHRLIDRNHVDNVEDAFLAIEFPSKKVWDELAGLMRSHPVLLSFPHQLTRAAVQTFEPVFTAGKAIQIHPTVAQQLSIEFSGQSAIVHLPLSLPAQVEASVLTASVQSVVSGRDGSVDQRVAKDASVGIYYLTLAAAKHAQGKEFESSIPLIGSTVELEHAIDTGHLHLHDVVRTRLPKGRDVVDGKAGGSLIVTTAGRMLFNEWLPAELPYYNEPIRETQLTQIIEQCLSKYGRKATVKLVESLSRLGWSTITRSGVSLGLRDLRVSTEKEKHLAEAMKTVNRLKKLHKNGLISSVEKSNGEYDAWKQAGERAITDVAQTLELPEYRLDLLSLRGFRSYSNANHLCGMIGFPRTDPLSNKLLPICSNFGEGLRSIEYLQLVAEGQFRSNSLRLRAKRRRSWQLARKMAGAMQEIRVSMHDCGASEGIRKRVVCEGEVVAIPLAKRLVGRVSNQRILDPGSGEVAVDRNQVITSEVAQRLERTGLQHCEVRSPLYCQAPEGVCQLCYGVNPATGSLPEVGEKAGLQSALAICEQASRIGELRTFIFGFATSPRYGRKYDYEQGRAVAYSGGRVQLDESQCVLNRDGRAIVVSRSCRLTIVDGESRPIDLFEIPHAALLHVRNDEEVCRGKLLAEWTPGSDKLIAAQDGRLCLTNVEVNRDENGEPILPWVVQKSSPSETPMLAVIDEQARTLQARYLYAGTQVYFGQGSQVAAGDVLAMWHHPPALAWSPWRSGTMEQFEDLLNVSSAIPQAIMAEFEGELSVYQGKDGVHMKLTSLDRSTVREYSIPHGSSIFSVYADPTLLSVRAGERLSLGEESFHDVLRILGLPSFYERWLSEMLQIYVSQNRLSIAEQHLEVLLRQLTRYGEITDAGDTGLVNGAIVDRKQLEQINADLSSNYVKIREPGGSGLASGDIISRELLADIASQATLAPTCARPRRATARVIAIGVDKLSGVRELSMYSNRSILLARPSQR